MQQHNDRRHLEIGDKIERKIDRLIRRNRHATDPVQAPELDNKLLKMFDTQLQAAGENDTQDEKLEELQKQVDRLRKKLDKQEKRRDREARKSQTAEQMQYGYFINPNTGQVSLVPMQGAQIMGIPQTPQNFIP